MNQRLYFLLPDREHTLDIIEQLKEQGFNTQQMHTVAGGSSWNTPLLGT